MLHTLLHLSKHRNLYGTCRDYNNRVHTLSVSPAIVVVDVAVYRRWPPVVHSIILFLGERVTLLLQLMVSDVQQDCQQPASFLHWQINLTPLFIIRGAWAAGLSAHDVLKIVLTFIHSSPNHNDFFPNWLCLLISWFLNTTDLNAMWIFPWKCEWFKDS